MRFSSLFIVMLFSTISCKELPDQIELDYCKMLENDQEFVNYDKSSSDYISDKINRRKIYHHNFNAILDYTRKNGFPKIDIKNSSTDSCMYLAITGTFIHIAQVDLNTYSKKEVKELLTSEIAKGNLKKELIAKSFCIALNTLDSCKYSNGSLDNLVSSYKLNNESYQGESLGELLHAYRTKCTQLNFDAF